MSRTSVEQRALTMVTLFEGSGRQVKSVTVKGQEIKIEFGESEPYDPAKDFDNIDWSS